MSAVFKIADILVSHAKKVHGEEIGIIAYYGSHAKGTATPTSDLDIYYVPDEGKAGTLSTTFIIDDLPYDFWGPPWRLLEEIANARSRRPWAVSASMVADTEVLYSRSQLDLERFNALKNRIKELLQPESHSYMVERALDEFRTTLFQLGQMRLANIAGDVPGLHWAGWKFVSSAINCLALVNQTYFSKGWGNNTAQIMQMKLKPDDLETLLNGILQPGTPAKTLELADRLAGEVRIILRHAQDNLATPSIPQEVFKDFYYYVHEYNNKILSACEKAEALAASSAAFHLQELICVLMNKVGVGFYGEDFNLLGEYLGSYQKAGFPNLLDPASKGDFQTLKRRAALLDHQFKVWLVQHSIDLNIMENETELKQFLDQRDPYR